MAWRTSPEGLMRRSREAFGEWLSRPEWQWYTTHTFRADYVSRKAADRAWYGWFNALRISAKAKGLTPSVYGQDSPFYFRATEYQEDRQVIHFHSLIGQVGDIRRLTFKDYWELHGFARVEKYDPGLGANFYVGKYITKDNGDIRFSHNLNKYLTNGNEYVTNR